ncbi:MAG TPA: PAS domain S-box protein, partial [Anaerolineae bacterium]
MNQPEHLAQTHLPDRSIRALLIEDDPADAHLIRERLAGAVLGPTPAMDLKLMRTGRLDAGLAMLAEQAFDVVLLDLSLPDSSGIVNLKKVRSQSPRVPIIVFGGSSDDAAVLEALREGAQEYLVKGHANGAALIRAIQSAMARQPVNADLVSSRDPVEDRLNSTERALSHSILDALDEGMAVSGPDGIITFANARLGEMLGLPANELIGKHSLSIYLPDERMHALNETGHRLKDDKSFYGSMLVAKEGPGIPVFVTASPLQANGQFAGTVTTFTGIAELSNAQAVRTFQASVVESSVDAILSENLDGIITSWNRGAELLYGYFENQAIGKHASFYTPPELADEIPNVLERIKRGETVERYETVRVKRNGERVAVSMAISPILDLAGWIVGASSIAHALAAPKPAQAPLQHPLGENAARRNIDFLNSDRLDLQVALNILLDQAIGRLHVDAAAVLLLNPQAQTLECAATRGFHGEAFAGAPV